MVPYGITWARFQGCLLLGVSSDYAQPITGQVTEVTCPVIGRAQSELILSKRQKTGPGYILKVLYIFTNVDTLSFVVLLICHHLLKNIH